MYMFCLKLPEPICKKCYTEGHKSTKVIGPGHWRIQSIYVSPHIIVYGNNYNVTCQSKTVNEQVWSQDFVVFEIGKVLSVQHGGSDMKRHPNLYQNVKLVPIFRFFHGIMVWYEANKTGQGNCYEGSTKCWQLIKKRRFKP